MTLLELIVVTIIVAIMDTVAFVAMSDMKDEINNRVENNKINNGEVINDPEVLKYDSFIINN